MIRNNDTHFTKIFKKIIEIKGERLEQYYLNQIKKKMMNKIKKMKMAKNI